MADNNQVEIIKEKADIVSIVERYVKLKKAGKNYVGLCPFHSEKTPSFNVSPDIQIYKCFGCGKSGDVITFIQEIEKLDFREALEKLAKETGVQLETIQRDDPFKLYYDLNKLAAEIFFRLLKANDQVKKYLYSRKITDADIEKFKIGFAPGNNIVLNKVRERYKLNNKQLLDSGLFIEKGGIFRDKFINRVMFPITSASGKIIGFTGRILPNDNYGPKYMNTPETYIFHKSKNVYGLHQSKPDIRKQDLCIICEGTTDVIAAHRDGVTNIVAPLGTSLTFDQLTLISQFTKNLLFIFDSDFAGQKALQRAFTIAEDLGMNSYAINTKPYKDIDEVIQNKPGLFSQMVSEKRTDAYTYLIQSEYETLDITVKEDLEKLNYYSKQLLTHVRDKGKEDFYKKKFREIVGERAAIEIQERGYGLSQKESSDKLSFEEYYLKILLSGETVSIPDHHDLTIFGNSMVTSILDIAKGLKGASISQLHKKLNKSLQQYLEIILLSSQLATSEELDKIYSRILKIDIQQKIANARVKLALAENMKDNESVDRIFAQINDLMAKLREVKT
ncbi:MAG: primase protein [candidate division WS6 bacterium GW2011_GWF2_39_15]|uniref:DNA primase n=1 Tax=candidate division WS6 bacterium GW2011_GWF2_39_15 TaxID=1619100 RepID=A0A0G0MQW9_9BACT|nr:MAG: primase protein [candidate division WS6 bacterium GW2011_GWF2_39_15]